MNPTSAEGLSLKGCSQVDTNLHSHLASNKQQLTSDKQQYCFVSL